MAEPKLAKYRAKRDFAVTDEPSGEHARPHAGLAYVIQKHAARRLHYDFRLELDGVLLSWAVPKGPSLAPRSRRLAVRVEDHPLDYAGFEGVIAKGEYGGGAVVVWDRGSWAPEGGLDGARAGLAKGRLTFTLTGEKLRGRWHLVRTKPQGKQDSWLLFKGRDDEARDGADEANIVDARPTSVISGRTIDEVARDADKVWHSNRAEPPEASPAPPSIASLVGQLPLGFPLTNLDKVLYPGHDITKAQLLAYYAVVADAMLVHLANRPLTLVRCPDGQGKPCWFQKHLGKGTPAPVHQVALTESAGDDEVYMMVDDLPGLVALAQLGCLEIHTWGSRAPDVEHPDIVVFDLDPDAGLPWERIALAALDVRRRLGELGLTSFVKTTGGKGLHVCVPIAPEGDWDAVKAWAKGIADHLERDDPAAYTANLSKSARKGRIFVDYLRNGRNATFIAPYSTRARPGAPIAVPITWDELAAGVDPTAFTLATVPQRLGALPDPWAGYSKAAAQSIKQPRPASKARSNRAASSSSRSAGAAGRTR